MAERSKLTFQETFGKVPFPQRVWDAIGTYPAQVLVSKATRSMQVTVTGPAVQDPAILRKAEEILVQSFKLTAATVSVDTPVQEAPQPAAPAPAVTPEIPTGESAGNLFARMEAMRKNVMGSAPAAPEAGLLITHHLPRAVK